MRLWQFAAQFSKLWQSVAAKRSDRQSASRWSALAQHAEPNAVDALECNPGLECVVQSLCSFSQLSVSISLGSRCASAQSTVWIENPSDIPSPILLILRPHASPIGTSKRTA
jgi:hypothetical protein